MLTPWRERILKVQRQLHFKYSQGLFEKRLKQFIEYVSGNSELAALTRNIVI